MASEGVAASSSARARRFDTFATLRAAAKGAWAVLDQGLFALSNFGISIVMARWLAPRDYGAFTLAYSVFLMLGTVHSSLLVEPMMVFGTGNYRNRFPGYLGILMQGHWLFTAAASLLLGAIGAGLYLIGEGVVSRAVFALAAMTPLILLLWLVRRVCYMHHKPHLAASGGVLYMAVLTGGAYALYRLGRLSSPMAFVLMGVGSLVSALWIKSRLPDATPDGTVGFRRTVAAQHWEYGRWAVGSGLLAGLVMTVYYFVMPLWHGLESAATLRALMNPVMPAQQAFLALWVVVLPRLVRARTTPAFGALIRRLLLVCCAAATANWLVLGLLHKYVVQILYGGAYSGSSHLLWILGLVPIGYAVIAILENALRSLERSDEVFRAYAAAAAASCVIGVPLAWFWGVSGAVVGLVLPCGVSVASMVRSLRAQGPHYRAGRVKYHSIHPAGGDTAMPLNLQKRLALTLRHCGSSDRRLIDCGCGAGEYVISLQRLGVQAWGIEYDRDKVAEFRKRYATSQRLCVGDVSNAGLMGSSFDVALLNEVLEHVPDDSGALSEVHRILRDDGLLILFSPNRRYPFETHGVSLARSGRRLPPYVPFVPYVPLWAGRLVFSYWARNYWPGELRRLVKEAGFTIVATDYVWQTFEAISRHQPALITAMAPLLRRTANLLERVPVLRSFGASQVIVARKSGTTRSGHSA